MERDFFPNEGLDLLAAAAFFTSFARLSLAVTPAATDNWSTSPIPISHSSFLPPSPLKVEAETLSEDLLSPNKGSRLPETLIHD